MDVKEIILWLDNSMNPNDAIDVNGSSLAKWLYIIYVQN